jgi:hypothetical protein
MSNPVHFSIEKTVYRRGFGDARFGVLIFIGTVLFIPSAAIPGRGPETFFIFIVRVFFIDDDP